MTISIEKVDSEHYIVRCVNPENPPFKATEVHSTIEAALKSASDMILFPMSHAEKKRVLNNGKRHK